MCAAKGLGKGDCDYKGVGSRMMLLGGVKTVLNVDFWWWLHGSVSVIKCHSTIY